MTKSDYIMVYVTFPSHYDMQGLCQFLLENKLAACIQLSNIQSFYIWNDLMQSDKEVQLSIKTSMKLLSQVEEHISNNHPYDVPQIISVPLYSANNPYKEWLKTCLV